MFFKKKLNKWIDLEIEELKKEIQYNVGNQGFIYKSKIEGQILALEGIRYIIHNKGVWFDYKGHGVFKCK